MKNLLSVDAIDDVLTDVELYRARENGLEKIPETVDEVIEVLFGGPEIVGFRPFTEGIACECGLEEIEVWDGNDNVWRRIPVMECEDYRTDIPGLAAYNGNERSRAISAEVHGLVPLRVPPSGRDRWQTIFDRSPLFAVNTG